MMKRRQAPLQSHRLRSDLGVLTVALGLVILLGLTPCFAQYVLVQQIAGGNSGGGLGGLSLPSTTTSGNLLVLAVGIRGNAYTTFSIGGWTLLHGANANRTIASQSAALWARLTPGGEQNFSLSAASAIIMEFSGPIQALTSAVEVYADMEIISTPTATIPALNVSSTGEDRLAVIAVWKYVATPNPSPSSASGYSVASDSGYAAFGNRHRLVTYFATSNESFPEATLSNTGTADDGMIIAVVFKPTPPDPVRSAMVTLRQSSCFGNSGSGIGSVTLPNATLTGSFLLTLAGIRGSSYSSVAMGGWKLFHGANSPQNNGIALFARISPGGETTFSLGSASACIFEYIGAVKSLPLALHSRTSFTATATPFAQLPEVSVPKYTESFVFSALWKYDATPAGSGSPSALYPYSSIGDTGYAANGNRFRLMAYHALNITGLDYPISVFPGSPLGPLGSAADMLALSVSIQATDALVAPPTVSPLVQAQGYGNSGGGVGTLTFPAPTIAGNLLLVVGGVRGNSGTQFSVTPNWVRLYSADTLALNTPSVGLAVWGKVSSVGETTASTSGGASALFFEYAAPFADLNSSLVVVDNSSLSVNYTNYITLPSVSLDPNWDNLVLSAVFKYIAAPTDGMPLAEPYYQLGADTGYAAFGNRHRLFGYFASGVTGDRFQSVSIGPMGTTDNSGVAVTVSFRILNGPQHPPSAPCTSENPSGFACVDGELVYTLNRLEICTRLAYTKSTLSSLLSAVMIIGTNVRFPYGLVIGPGASLIVKNAVVTIIGALIGDLHLEHLASINITAPNQVATVFGDMIMQSSSTVAVTANPAQSPLTVWGCYGFNASLVFDFTSPPSTGDQLVQVITAQRSSCPGYVFGSVDVLSSQRGCDGTNENATETSSSLAVYFYLDPSQCSAGSSSLINYFMTIATLTLTLLTFTLRTSM